MSDRYRIPDSDNRGEHARPTRPILVLITVLIQSVIAARVSRDDKLPDKLSRSLPLLFFLSFFLLLFFLSVLFLPPQREQTLSAEILSLLGPVLRESRPRSIERGLIIPKSILFKPFF